MVLQRGAAGLRRRQDTSHLLLLWQMTQGGVVACAHTRRCSTTGINIMAWTPLALLLCL
jgi:hypothetical protein